MGRTTGANGESSTTHRRRWTYLIAGVFGIGVLSLTGAGVYAGLTATATGTQTVTSGTLSLTLSPNALSGGFGQTISNMAPGDQNNVYVKLNNGGTLAATGLTLGVTGTGGTLLTTDAVKGLAVTITGCTVAWTVTTGTPGSGLCTGGTTSTVLASTPVATLSGTPSALTPSALAVSQALFLQVNLMLPDQSENTLNGTPPTPTIQGLSTVLTYSFNEAQRTAQITTS
jgi:spore coat-associated protein N